jgi:FkbM family methyltransferase
MINKLRQCFRIIFPKKYTLEQEFYNNLFHNPLISTFTRIDDYFELKLINDLKIFIRDYRHSDFLVFDQILVKEEYKIIRSIFRHHGLKENLNIIDAGANIGFTTLYLSKYLKYSNFICIEPFKSNIKFLEMNLNSLQNNHFKVYKNALANNTNLKFSFDDNFRDGLDWALTTQENENGDIQGITIIDIFEQNNFSEVDFLKIDIEGAERFIFNKKQDVSFLSKVKIIAIEIHDEFNMRSEINELLKINGFVIFKEGEITIGINKILL